MENLNLNLDDWRDDIKENLIENGMDEKDITEDMLYETMVETNNDYLDDERVNLGSVQMNTIIAIGDVGRWNGRFSGYKMIESGKISDCLYSECDLAEFYIDKNGDLCATEIHHDGTNHYVFREIKSTATDTQIENLQDKLYDNTATRTDIVRITNRLGDTIANVYGFDIPKAKGKKKDLER